MNRTGTTLLSLLSLLVTALATSSLGAWQDHIQWQFDLEKAKQIAAQEDKLILLHFSASWCGPCKEIERFVFVNPMAIRAISGQVVPVKIDVDMKKEIAEEYNVSTVPYDVIINAAGHVVAERSSPRSTDGYLQLIQNGKSASTNLAEGVAADLRDLKKEMARQKKMVAKKKPAAESYGSLAASDSNQFQQTYSSPPGANVPAFKPPKPWTQTEVTTSVPATRDGVVRNRFAAGNTEFQPTAPSVQAPSGTAPQRPTAPGMQTDSFVPAPSVASSGANNFKTTYGAGSNEGGQLQPSSFQPNSFQPDSFQPGLKRTSNNSSASHQATGPGGAATTTTGGPESQFANVIRRPQPPAKSQRILNPMAQPALPESTLPESTSEFVAAAEPDHPMPAALSLSPATDASSPKQNADEQLAFQPESQLSNQATSPATTAAPTESTGQQAIGNLPQLGLEGYCSVTLMEKKAWKKGEKQWGCMHRGRLYLFASKEYRDQFQLSPDMYSPLLGGADPVDFHVNGGLNDGQRRHGFFYGEEGGPEVIVLFTSKENQARFEADPADYLRTVRQAMSRVDSDLLLR